MKFFLWQLVYLLTGAAAIGIPIFMMIYMPLVLVGGLVSIFFLVMAYALGTSIWGEDFEGY